MSLAALSRIGENSNAVYYLNIVLPDAEAEVTDYLDIIAGETRNAEKIISDLLDFSRVKSLNRQEIRVDDAVALALEKHAPPDMVRVTTEIPDGLPAIIADLLQVEQVLSNLVTNAYQAMPQGGTLNISARFESEMVSIAVSDTGVGIRPEHLETIFEPLFTTKSKGFGLGLAVCKSLIEANGGTIEATSTEGQGSTFILHLPGVEKERRS